MVSYRKAHETHERLQPPRTAPALPVGRAAWAGQILCLHTYCMIKIAVNSHVFVKHGVLKGDSSFVEFRGATRLVHSRPIAAAANEDDDDQ